MAEQKEDKSMKAAIITSSDSGYAGESRKSVTDRLSAFGFKTDTE